MASETTEAALGESGKAARLAEAGDASERDEAPHPNARRDAVKAKLENIRVAARTAKRQMDIHGLADAVVALVDLLDSDR